MSIQGQIIVIFLCFLISFSYIRSFIYGIKRYQLNNSAYKKRKKNETLIEWLLYLKYREEIPKIIRLLYYFVVLIHFVCLVACIFFYIINFSFEIEEFLVRFIVFFDAVWMLIIALLFWSPKPDYAYDRWITKKRGQRRK